MRVVVAGAGIVGAALTRQLAQHGHETVVVDEHAACRGASRASFAWLNSNNRQTGEYHALSLLGMAGYRELRRCSRYAPMVHFGGNLEVATTEAALTSVATRVARLGALGYPARVVTAQELRARGLVLSTGEEALGGAFFPDEGYVDVEPLVWTMLAEAREHGAVVRRGAPVDAVALSSGRVRGIRLRDGDVVEADVCVLACGVAVNGLLNPLGVTIPQKGKVGSAITTTPGAPQFTTIVHLPGISVRPAGGGRLLVHVEACDRLAADEGSVPWNSPSFQEVWDAAVQRFAPMGGEWVVTDAWAARRPQPADGLPVVGPVAGVAGLWVVCTHSGVTLAPALAQLLCTGLEEEQVPQALQPYQITRFTTS